MNTPLNMDLQTLLLASLLVLVSLLFSWKQKLHLEKETVISVIRAILQLVAVGFVLNLIFGMKNPLFTALLLLFMSMNAALSAAKRGKGIRHVFKISLGSILGGSAATLSVLVFSGAIAFEPQQMIPVGGMIISNSMVALGLCYRQMLTLFKDRRPEVETALALGADPAQASSEIIRETIRTGMTPTIDSAKTLGIVSLPGMMTGLILAGTPPLLAIRYQLMVTFMLLSTTAIAASMACLLARRSFFTPRKQLRL